MSLTQKIHATHRTQLSAFAVLAPILGVWLAAAVGLGGVGWFVTPEGQPPLRLLVAVLGPVLVFAAAYGLSPRFRLFVQAGDPEWLTTLQSWRILGGMFLVLLSFGLLPAAFAWPAGLGDVAIGVTAPFVARAFARRGQGSARLLFAVWNFLGILDLVVAVSMGATLRTLPVLTGGSASAELTVAMSQLPLSLVPTFGVPLFLILHLACLVQLRNVDRAVQEETSHAFVG